MSKKLEERLAELIAEKIASGEESTLVYDAERSDSIVFKIWENLMDREEIEWVNIEFGVGDATYRIFYWDEKKNKF